MNDSNMNSVLEYIIKYSKETPDVLSCADAKRKLTYGELMARILGFAGYLRHIGINKGDLVVIICAQKVEYIITEFALHALGAVFVPLEKSVSVERVKEILALTDSKLLVSDRETDIDIANLKLSDILTESYQNNKLDLSDITLPAPEDTSEVLFTTGTTGKEKGVEMAYAGSVAVAENARDGVHLKKDNVDIIPVPINHVLGLRRCYTSLVNGSSLVLCDGVTFMQDFFNLVDFYRVTSMTLVPAYINILTGIGRTKLIQYRDQIRFVQAGGAKLQEQDKENLKECLPDTRLFDMYGCTEAGVACAIDYNSEEALPSSIGWPTVNSEIAFFDRDANRILPTKETPGFIAIKGTMTMKGYYKDPELTKKTMIDGYVITNDLGYLEADNSIIILGRDDDVINIGGSKVDPSEIEDHVSRIGGISDCACIAVEDDIFGQTPKLFVVMDEGADFDPERILRILRARLENFKMPRIVVQTDEIPRTYNGKIKRDILGAD